MDLSHPLDDLLGANTARVLQRLSILNTELTGRRVADLSGVPVASAARVLAELERIGLVSSRSVGSARLYKLNRDHILWSPIQQIIDSPARIEKIAAEVASIRVHGRASVATFGSFARNQAGTSSDVDLLVVWDAAVTPEERSNVLDALNEEISLATGNRVEVVELEDDDLRRMARRGDPLIESWRRDARTVAGPDIQTRLMLASV